MKKFSFILLLLVIFGCLSLEAKRIRLLGSRSKQPVELANVCFLRNDSTIMEALLSDSAGFFNLPENNEIVYCKITAIGYDDLLRNAASLSDNQDLTLEEKATDLSELTVKGRKSPYTVKPDRIIFNPEFAAFATSAYDIVCAAPGVIESDGVVAMPKKMGVKILIDGKEQRGDLKDVMNLLKSYQAQDIKSVEVISAPSARYSRGTDIGVINIILKKRATDFLGGSASYTMEATNRVSNNLSGALNYRTDRLSASLNAYGSLGNYAFLQTNTLSYDEIVRKMRSHVTRTHNNLTLKAAVDYTISQKWDVAFNYFLGFSDMRHRDREKYNYYREEEWFDEVKAYNRRHEKSTSNYVYAETNGKLSSKTTFTASLDYYDKSYPSTRSEKNGQEIMIMWQDNKLNSSSVTAHANFDIALSDALKLDFGADYLHTKSNSKADYFFLNDGETGHKFDYKENELDIFGQVKYSFAKKWYLSAMMKYQYVGSKSTTTQDVTDIFSLDRSDFTPSIYLTYTLNKKNSFNLSYFYNTVKPAISALNPMMLSLGNDTYRVGNPALKDARHFMVSLSYNFGTLTIEPYFEWLSDGIDENGRMNDDGSVIYSWGNNTNVRTSGLFIYWAWSGLSWMNFSAFQFLSYKHIFSSSKEVPFDCNAWYYSIQPRVQFFFDKSRKFVFSLNGYYTTKSVYPDYTTDPKWKLSASLVWRPSNQWTISLSGNDLLYSRTSGYHTLTGAKLRYNNKYVYPGVSLTASFVWGKSAKWRRESSTRSTMDERTNINN